MKLRDCKKQKNFAPFRYSIRFTTVYTPGTIKNISMLEAPLKTFEKKRPKAAHKLLVKQSYMMLT